MLFLNFPSFLKALWLSNIGFSELSQRFEGIFGFESIVTSSAAKDNVKSSAAGTEIVTFSTDEAFDTLLGGREEFQKDEL